MITFKNKRGLKLAVGLFFLLGTATLLDMNFPKSNSNIVEARFLGTGVKTEVMPCVMGAQQTEHTVTILWIKVGESWITESPC